MKYVRSIALLAVSSTCVAAANGCSSAPAGSPEATAASSEAESIPMTNRSIGSTVPGESGPSCSGPAHLVSGGGRFTGGAVHLVPVFWGSNVASDTKSNIGTFLNVYSSSSLAEMIKSEYGFPGTVVDSGVTITPHVSTGSSVGDSDIQAELNWQVNNGHLASSGNYLYLVHFSPTVTPQSGGQNACAPNSGGGYWCAYHNSLRGAQLTYAVIPDHSQGQCATHWCANGVPNSFAAMTVGESHEISETLTDPDVRTGFRVTSKDPGCNGAEIGDVCQSQSTTISNGAGSAWVQLEWSNKGNACVTGPQSQGDLNGDGLADLVLTGGAGWGSMPIAFSNGNGTYYGRNNGETSGDTGFPVYATQTGAKPVAGDFDGDGRSDIALVGGVGWGSMPIAFSNGDGTYHGANNGEISGDTGFPIYATQNGAKPVTGDFDGDGRADIALVGGVGWNTIPVAFSNGDGSYHGTNHGETWGDTGFPVYATQSGAKPVAGDFNCDGLSDIALVGGVGWNTMPIAFSNGDGTFHGTNHGETWGDTGFPVYATQSGAKPVSGDFNGDCYADIALTGGVGWGSMPIAFSNGDGTYHGTNNGETWGDTGFPIYATQSGAKPVAGDFNADGVSDIALTGGVSWGSMPIAFSNGDGSYHGTNNTETSGDTGFPVYATQSGAKPVTR